MSTSSTENINDAEKHIVLADTHKEEGNTLGSPQDIEDTTKKAENDVALKAVHKEEDTTLMDCDFGGDSQTFPYVVIAAAGGQNDFITSISEGKDSASNANDSQVSSKKVESPKSHDLGSTNIGRRKAKSDPRTHFDMAQDDMSSDSDSDSQEKELPTLLKRLSMTPSRNRTRLQDTPRLTPAMQRQLTHCRSTALNRTKSLNASNDERNSKGEDELDDVGGGDSENNAQDQMLDEECEIVDEDGIPAKKKKKLKENMWLFYLQLIFLLILIAFLPLSYKIGLLRDTIFFTLHLWRWDSLVLVIFCGHLLSGWVVKLVEMVIARQYALKKRVLYFVYGLRGSVKNCMWLALILAVWESIFFGLEDNLLVNILTKILWCLFTASVSLMIKVLAVKIAANNFHRKAYFDRIQECIFNQHILEVLSGPPTMKAGSRSDESQKQSTDEDYNKTKDQSSDAKIVSSEGETPAYTAVEVGDLPEPVSSDSHTLKRQKTIMERTLPVEESKIQELTSDTVSVWTLKSLMKVIRKTNVSTYSSIMSKEKKDGEISSEVQAKAAAKQIFYNMAQPGKKCLTIKDFLYFLPEDEAIRAFSLFQINESGEITKKALTNWVISVLTERRALALTLNDSKTVIAKLHKVLNFVLSLALIIVFLLIFGIETSKLLVFFTSVFIPSVFIFGNSARSTFEALVFLFVVHPFDVGDRIFVDGQSMIVEEMNILNTIFLGPINEKIYYPNSILTQKTLVNYYRSPDMGDAIDFQIHMKTPVEKLGILKERMQRYIESLPQFWYPDFRILCDKVIDCNKVNMMIWMRHRINYQIAGLISALLIKRLQVMAGVVYIAFILSF